MSTNDMEAVAELARRMGEVALGYFGRGVEVELKANQTPVTVADRAAEQVARTWVSERFPKDGVLGEELGAFQPEATRRWILDPVDGTRTFIRGVPLWGSLVALVEGEEVLAGAAFFPALGELLVGARGQGAFWNGARCAVSREVELGRALVLTTDPRFDSGPEARASFERLERAAGLSRSWGDCYGYLLVATGRAEAMVDVGVSPWDVAAFLPILEEAGGVFTDWRGRRTAFGGDVVATNGALADPVRAVLGGGR